MKIALCLLCFKPSQEWITFLSSFKKYDIFVVVDDNTVVYPNVIQIPNTLCATNGFMNLNFTLHKDITAWEKALYFFSTQSYDYVWFIEDDVYFHSEDTLVALDDKYPTSDLLSNNYGINPEGTNQDWHWNKISIHLPPPYFCAMVCANRMSKTLLTKIADYASLHHTLFFLEACFSTLCMHHKLRYDTPEELHTITYKKQFTLQDINATSLFHPMKQLSLHATLRTL